MDLENMILTRRSTRKFLSRPVEEEKIEKLLLAAKHAPSGGNSQACHFYVVRDQEMLNGLKDVVQQAFAKMTYDETTYVSLVNSIRASLRGNYVFHYDAPLFIIVTNRKGYGNAMADSACAMENMMLAANALDLGSCWINQLHWLEENEEVREYLSRYGIGKEETITASLSVGYPDTEDGLPNRKAKKIVGNLVTYIDGK